MGDSSMLSCPPFLQLELRIVEIVEIVYNHVFQFQPIPLSWAGGEAPELKYPRRTYDVIGNQALADVDL